MRLMNGLMGMFLFLLSMGCSQTEKGIHEEPVAPRMNQETVVPDKGLVSFKALTEKPVLKKRVEPQYPESALEQKLEGRVILKGTIREDGNVYDILVVSSSGVGEMDRRAIDAFRQFEFIPGKVNGVPVRVHIVVPFHFRVQKHPS